VVRIPPAITTQAKEFHLQRKKEREKEKARKQKEMLELKEQAERQRLMTERRKSIMPSDRQKSVMPVPSLKMEKLQDKKETKESKETKILERTSGRFQEKKPLNLSVNVTAEVIPFVPESTSASTAYATSKRKPLPPPMLMSASDEEHPPAPVPKTALRKKAGLSIDTAVAPTSPSQEAEKMFKDDSKPSQPKDLSSSTEEIEKPLHELLLERSERLYEQGEYLEALKSARESETAASEHSVRQKQGKVKPSNAECYRCGDFVSAQNDKQGYSHHEWRTRHSSQLVKENAKKVEEKTKSLRRRGRTAQLDQFLGKLEAESEKTREALPDAISEVWQTTMCAICLSEVEKESWNRHLVRNIRQYRRGGN